MAGSQSGQARRPGRRGGWRDDGTFSYTANDATMADVDGDGQQEIILKWDPTNARDNAHDGCTGSTLIDCYKVDWAGLVALSGWIVPLLLAMSDVTDTGWTPTAIGLLVTAVVMLGVFIAVELRSPEPLIPPSLFAIRTIARCTSHTASVSHTATARAMLGPGATLADVETLAALYSLADKPRLTEQEILQAHAYRAELMIRHDDVALRVAIGPSSVTVR
jgi:hypothetical protein